MNVDFPNIFYYSCLLLSAATGLYCIKRVDIAFKWLAILIFLTLVSEFIAKYLSYGLEKHNSIVYHIFTPIEYTLYVIIFIKLLGSRKHEKLLWLSVICLFLLEIINTLLFQPLDTACSNVIMVECVLLVFLSLLLFLKIRETPSPGNLLREGVFWFNSAVLCYYAFNTLWWGFHNMEVYNMDNPPMILYQLNKILSGFLYLTFSTAILLNAVARSSIFKKI